MKGALVQLVYVSSAVRELSERELAELLEQTRVRNAASGITGMLVYAGGNFMQVLEGPGPVVEQTLSRIRLDSRHKGVIVMLKAEVPERYFPQWSMAFECIRDKEELARIPGYQDLRSLTQAELESTAHKLIRRFTFNMTGMAIGDF